MGGIGRRHQEGKAEPVATGLHCTTTSQEGAAQMDEEPGDTTILQVFGIILVYGWLLGLLTGWLLWY
jgi:hypothetical protein